MPIVTPSIDANAVVIAATAATVVPADSAPTRGWHRVADAHGSSLEVPTALVRRTGDPTSLVFTAGDGTRVTFETITEARTGFPGNDPAGDIAGGRTECASWPPLYRVVKERLAAYSCVKGAAIVYYAARYNGSGSVVLHATYPKARAAIWDKAVARMSTSMRQLARSEHRP